MNDVNGVLLIYHHFLTSNAPTIMEHVNAFQRYSHFRVWSVNTELGFPKGLHELRFRIIVLHYSLFASHYLLDEEFLAYLAQSDSSYKIALFQDEHHYCQQRFAFLNRYNIDCVYTLLEPAYFKDVYQKYTQVPNLVYNIPGYVDEDLVALARKMAKPDQDRKIDIGYRGRPLGFYMGKGGQEKTEIALGFLKRARNLGLRLDIGTEERQRIYGKTWYSFLSNCRAVLGVEAGVSIFDLEDRVRQECERLLDANPKISFGEISARVLGKWEGNIFYRTISPRHFEAAALRVCQILFEGKYSGIMQPMVHYIPLKKDWSNFDDVIRMFKDERLRHELTENAYRDLIASGRYSYQSFIEDFDQELLGEGFQPRITPEDVSRVTRFLIQRSTVHLIRARLRGVWLSPFPGRSRIVSLAKPLVTRFRRWKRNRLLKVDSHV